MKAYSLLAVFASTLLLLSGCQTPGSATTSWDNWWGEEEPEYSTPVRMAVVWTADVIAEPGKPPMRGFGGRVFLYDENHKPIEAHGELVVYAFNDSSERKMNQADRKFVFPAEKFAQRFSANQLGPSYSVWLPWDVVGGKQLDVSLLPVFKPQDANPVMGQHALTVLPGEENNDSLHSEEGLSQTRDPYTRSKQIRNVTYHDIKPYDPGIELQTTTISVPQAMQRRLQQASSARLASQAPGTVRNNARFNTNAGNAVSQSLPQRAANSEGYTPIQSQPQAQPNVRSFVQSPANAVSPATATQPVANTSNRPGGRSPYVERAGYRRDIREAAEARRAAVWNPPAPLQARYEQIQYQAPSSQSFQPSSGGSRLQPPQIGSAYGPQPGQQSQRPGSVEALQSVLQDSY